MGLLSQTKGFQIWNFSFCMFLMEIKTPEDPQLGKNGKSNMKSYIAFIISLSHILINISFINMQPWFEFHDKMTFPTEFKASFAYMEFDQKSDIFRSLFLVIFAD